MEKPYGLLVAGFNYSSIFEDEFHDWYDTEHVPERARVPGFHNTQRWLGHKNPKIAIATYDLESIDVLDTPAYRAIGGENLSPWSKRVVGKVERVCRFEGEQILPGRQKAPDDAGGLMLFAMNIAPEAEAEFNQWYDTEHIPALSALPGCLSARRFRVQGTRGNAMQRYLALYHLAAPEVCLSKDWEAAAMTPWTKKLLKQSSDILHLVLRKYVRGA